MTTELRRHLRVRVLAPLACSFARIGLQRWLAAERAWFGVEFDVSLNGAKVMIPASMNMGDQLAISLRLPDQIATMNVDAIVRWGHTLGLEFTTLSQFAETRMRKFLSRAPSPQS